MKLNSRQQHLAELIDINWNENIRIGKLIITIFERKKITNPEK